MEVVFVSSDASLDEYQISVSGYDWPSVPYERRDIKEMLISKFGFKTVPQLVILDTSTGKVVDAKARRTFEGLQDDIGMIINTISRAEFSL
jgi:glutaredoxin